MTHDVKAVAEHFAVSGEPTDITAVTTGHINDTYVLTARVDGRTIRYVLQRINHNVFKDPPQVMANIVRVTEHIRSRTALTDPDLASRQLTVIPTRDGGSYYRDADGSFWRMYNFIEGAVTYDKPESAVIVREAARMFGWFQSMLTDLPGPSLHETIPGFHDTPRRLEVFRQVVKADAYNRAHGARPEIDFVFENTSIADVLPELVRMGRIPVRSTHNDTKINNVMLDEKTGRGICVIDLDTVMPGLSIHDFGDLVRTATCPAAEDERDLSRIAVSIGLFEALAEGFAEHTHPFLTPAERRHLVFGAKQITFEQMIRFLTDYLAGDVYYKVHREEHNLDRTRTQMQLMKSIVEQDEAMNELVDKAFRRYVA